MQTRKSKCMATLLFLSLIIIHINSTNQISAFSNHTQFIKSENHEYTVAVQYNLTISTTVGGSTDPKPGTHPYDAGTIVIVSSDDMLPNYYLDHWLVDGDSATGDCVVVTMNKNHYVTACYRLRHSEPPYNCTVGGVYVPVDKFGLLAPYIGLSSTILVATVATAVCVKRVKCRKEKQ